MAAEKIMTMISRTGLGLALAALIVAAPASAETAITQHVYHRNGMALPYTAEAGRIALHDPKGGAVTGRMFYVAYRVVAKGKPRPVTFLWNGGPGSNSVPLHFEAFGPKRLVGDHLVDNAATLLTRSDLVFVDPIGTGFSRAASPQDAKRFYSTSGDFAAMTQFVRRWLVQHHAAHAPVYLIGESFGVWRAAAVAQELEEQHQRVGGIVLISGGAGVGTGILPHTLVEALRTPNRAVTALFHGKLPADLRQGRKAVAQVATRWALNVYAPALADLASLTPERRAAIRTGLARIIGLKAAQIDADTLVVTPRAYRHDLLPSKVLDVFDMRRAAEPAEDSAAIETYLRHDLAYRTKLAYAGLDAADDAKDPTAPAPGWINRHWAYDTGKITPAVIAAAQAGEGPPGSEPWTLRAIAIDPHLKVMVAAGMYDSLNSCAANNALKARLPASAAGNFTMKCYWSGHMVYRDAAARARISADIKAFVSGAAEHR